MAKANVKALMAQKGERYALFAAGGLMLLLGVIGILNLSDAPDPEALVKGVEQSTSKITSAINNPNGEPDVLPSYAKDVYVPDAIRAADQKNIWFDPFNPPDQRRINPMVMGIAEIQADFIPAKIIALDIRNLENGDKEIGVLKFFAKRDDTRKNEISKFVDELKYRDKKLPKRKNRPMGPGPMGPGPMGLGPMGPGPGPMGMPPPAVPGKLIGMGKEAEAAPIDEGPRLGVEYIPLDEEKLVGKRLALTIYPQRMVVVQASFPYKKQIEEIQRALRLEKIYDVFSTPDAAPVFHGFVVERAIYRPNGQLLEDWRPLNVDEKYRETIYPRKFADKEEDQSLQYVMFVPPEQELVMPLPLLLSGSYPAPRLETIQETIRKFQSLNKPVEVPKPKSQLLGGGSIFQRTGVSAIGAQGQGGDINFQKMMGKGKEMMPMPGREPGQASQSFEIPEHCLVRFIDNDILPGRHYKYRVKLRMVNPNWVGEKDEKNNNQPKDKYKYDLVSRPSDADVEIIEGRFVETPGTVSSPTEEYMFAADPFVESKEPKEPKKPVIDLKPGQGLLQYQRWMPVASVGNYKEPVADWIVADVVVKRGAYVGGKQFVNLPIWSSEYNKYILREVPPEKGSRSREPRRGVVIDPTKPGPQYVVVDVEGGKPELKSYSKTITDESASEILLLDEDGNLRVRSSILDRTNAGRIEREETWRKWIEKTEKDSVGVTPATINPMPRFE